MKPADIYAALAQDRADAPDNTGYIVIAGDQHVTVWCCLDKKTVDLSYTSFASLFAIAKERSGYTSSGPSGTYFATNGRRHVSARADISGGDLYASLFCDQKSVDEVHASTDVSQKSGKKCTRNRRCIQVDYLAGEFKSDFTDRLINKLRLKP